MTGQNKAAQSWLINEFLLLSVVIVIFLLGVRGQNITQSMLNNMGAILLNKISKQSTESSLVETALKTLDLSITVSPDTPSTWRWQGYVLAYSGNEEAAVLAWQNNNLVYIELFQRGKLAYEAASYDEALRWLNRSIRVEPNYADAWYYIGLTYEALGEYLRAEQAYLNSAHSSNFAQIQAADVYFRLGWIVGQGSGEPDWPEALSYYDQAVALSDFSEEYIEIQAHTARGEALQKVGQSEQAISEFQWVLARDSGNMAAHVQLAFLMWGVYGDAATAEKLFLEAMAIDAGNKWPFRGLATIYQETGRVNEAVVMYQHAYSLDPNDVFVREKLEKLAVEEK